MNDWKPRPVPQLDARNLPLSAEEGYLLSRLDGQTSLSHLGLLVAMPQERIQQILVHLVEEGAISREGAPKELIGGSPGAAEAVASKMAAAETASKPAVAETASKPAASEKAAMEEALGDTVLKADEEAPPHKGTGERHTARLEHGGTERERPDEPSEEEGGTDEGPEEPVDEHRFLVEGSNYRKLFEEELHPLPRDQRIALAKTADNPALLAFCFDPDPEVIHSVLENLNVGLDHARYIAFHHRHATGLEILGTHREFLMDRQVQRQLLRNPQLSEGLYRRMMGSRPLKDLFKQSTDRDMPERTRRTAGLLMRSRFASCPGDEKVDLIFSTEGRVLPALVGLHFDSRAISLMCARTYHSTMLILNLARFPGTPAPVLAHLLRQEAVKRQPTIRSMLLQHPNTPSDLKRRG